MNQIKYTITAEKQLTAPVDKQACTHDTLRCQHYITTSKEYLTNSHILLKCWELVFLQL